jgi:hypothetical protein
VATKKGRTTNFFPPFSFVAVLGSGMYKIRIRDPGKTFRIQHCRLHNKDFKGLTIHFNQCCGSGMFIPDLGSDFFPSRIPDPNCLHPGSASKNLSILFILTEKKWFLSFRKYDPGCSSRIRMLTFYPSRIRDPGSRIQGSKMHRIPDPDPQQCFQQQKILISASLCGQLARRALSPHPFTSRPWRRETTAAAVAAATAASAPQDSCIIGLLSSSPAWLIPAVQLPHSGEFFKQLHDRVPIRETTAAAVAPAATAASGSCTIIGLPSSSPAWLIAAVQLSHSGEFFKQLHHRASF